MKEHYSAYPDRIDVKDLSALYGRSVVDFGITKLVWNQDTKSSPALRVTRKILTEYGSAFLGGIGGYMISDSMIESNRIKFSVGVTLVIAGLFRNIKR